MVILYSLIILVILVLFSILIFRWLVPNTKITGTANELSDEEQQEYLNLHNTTGITVTALKSSGKASFNGKIFPVEAAYNQFIDEGKEVKVVKIQGNKIIVENNNDEQT